LKPESENSDISELTEDQKDSCYKILKILHDIVTDTKNADLLMHQGKFFKALDMVRQSNQFAQIGEREVATFVKSLQDSKLWLSTG